MIVLPTIIFLGGAAIMTRLSGRAIATRQLESLSNKDDRTPLNSRLHYDTKAVTTHWGALKSDGLAAETRFLEIDLVFPLVYGGALLAALLFGWATLGRPFNPTWIVVAVAITVLADWAENLTQLGQIEGFARSGAAALDDGRIALASMATLIKLAGVFVLGAGTLTMAVLALFRKAV